MNKNNEKLDSIAIVGMTGRFPGAKNIEEFWDNLKNGVESISHIPDEKNPSYIHADGILDDIDKFDASFFGYSPREAEIIDPQHRIFLEESWKALETAGYTSDKYDGNISIYAGSNMSGYLIRNLYSHPELVEQLGTFKTMLANGQDFLSTRASYKMNLTGASVNFNTLCSSSLVAVHYACNDLLNYSTDVVIAGGVNIQVSRNEALFYQEGGIGASDGHCRAFDANANGTVSGSGIALIVLKRLEDALNDGDTIHAVIRGSAVNNDGANKNSYTAPNADGQAECIAEAIEMAEVNPETITYIEAHGTGTNLGDPIEIAGLTKAFRAYTDNTQYCAIGSVKTNIGHLVTAGGVASLIKTVLAMKNKQLPPSLNFEKPNPKINFENSPFYVNTELKEWKPTEIPLRAGVSSFGIGGTNAHVIIEEAPEQRKPSLSREWKLLCLSAKSESALEIISENVKDFIKNNNEINEADLAYTMNIGRKDFEYRKFYVFENLENLINDISKEKNSFHQKQKNTPAVFMFPGDGNQYINMCKDLYIKETDFKKYFDECNDIIDKKSGIDLKSIIYPDNNLKDENIEKIKKVEFSKLALFVIEYSLAKLMETWGIIPEYVMGQDIGELTACCISGVISLDDTLKILLSNQEDLKQVISEIIINPPQIQIVSSLTGTWLTENDFSDSNYLYNLFERSDDDDSIKFLLENINGNLLEVGPGKTFNIAIKQLGNKNVLNLIREENESVSDIKILIKFLGEYWLSGGNLNWKDFYKNEKRNHISLPTYPFEKQSYWIEPLKTDVQKNIDNVIKINSENDLSSLSNTNNIENASLDLFFNLNSSNFKSLNNKEKIKKFLSIKNQIEENINSIIKEETEIISNLEIKIKFKENIKNNNKSALDNLKLKSRPNLEIPFEKPKSETEKIITKKWEEVLGIEGIGINDDFYELGGHSLLAASIAANLADIFKIQIPLAELLDLPTVQKLAEVVDNYNWAVADNKQNLSSEDQIEGEI